MTKSMNEKQVEKRLDDEIKWFKKYHDVDSDWTSKSVLILLKRIKNG